MRAWIAIAMQRSVRQRAIKMAAVVGSILVVINQWDILVSGSLTTKTLVKIGLTFVVPYCVSTFASVQAIRHLLAGDAGSRTAENGARESESRRSS